MEEEERRRPRRGGRRTHDASNHFFRRGPARVAPPCCRQERRRGEEETDAYTVYTPEMQEEARERERRRDERRRHMRNRIREEEQMESEGRKKKKTTKSKLRRYSNCFCGILIVLGLIFVFYVITTLIIDGSSPLDFLLYENEKNISSSQPPDDTGFENTRNVSKDETSTIGNVDVRKKPGITSTGNAKIPGQNVPQLNDSLSGGNYQYQFYPGNEDHNSDQNVTYIEGPEGRSYIAYIPVPLDNQEDEEEEEYEYEEDEDESRRTKKNRGRKSEKEVTAKPKPVLVPVMIMPEDNKEESKIGLRNVNRHGLIPKNYNRERKLDNFRDNYRRTYENHNSGRMVPESFERDRYNRRRIPFSPKSHKSKLIPMRPPKLPTLGRPRERLLNRNRPSQNYNKYKVNTPSRNEYTTRRRNSWQKDAERGPPNNNKSGIKRFGNFPSESSRYDPNSRPVPFLRETSLPNPRYINRDLTRRQKYDLYRQYVANAKKRRRPIRRDRKQPKVPPEFRYPPNAHNIQDIIRHMDGSDEEIHQYASNSDTNDERSRGENLHSRYMPSDLYVGNQDHVIGHNVFEPNNGHVIGNQDHILEDYDFKNSLSDIKIETNDDVQYGRYPSHRPRPTNQYSNEYSSDLNGNNYHISNDYGETYANHNNQGSNNYQYGGSDYNSHPLPPVQNTYDVFNANERSKTSHHPLRLMLDIYPVDDYQSASSNRMQSILRVGDDNRVYQEGRDHKKQIILHLNLLSKPPSHRSESRQDSKMGVSLEIPLNGGLSPLDIYRAIIAEARRGPVASAQKDNEGNTRNSEKSGDQVEIELYDVEEGPILYASLEEGLHKLNRYLPAGNKIQFSNIPVTKEDLLKAGNTVEILPKEDKEKRNEPSPRKVVNNPFFDDTVHIEDWEVIGS